MSLSVTYASTRREVLAFYWRMWRQRLWKTHLAIFIATVIFASLAMFGGWPTNGAEAAIVLPIGFLPLLLLALYPMLMFKPQTRVLTVDDAGIATSIGKASQVLAWDKIADVKSSGNAFIIQRHNLNAFIVPARAFRTAEAKVRFEEFVRTCLQANAG